MKIHFESFKFSPRSWRLAYKSSTRKVIEYFQKEGHVGDFFFIDILIDADGDYYSVNITDNRPEYD